MFKKSRLVFLLVAFGALTALVTACGSSSGGTNTASSTPGHLNCVSGTLQVTGSTAMQYLVQDVADAYQSQCPNAKITVNGNSTTAGLGDVTNGSSGIGDSDIFADPKQFPGLVDHQVAVVVFSVILNKKVTGVTNLTSAQLKSIYTGAITNWKELGGPDLLITPVSRPPGSGTRISFEQYVLGTKENIPQGKPNPTESSNGQVANTVDQTDGAISYIATSYAQKHTLTLVKLNGIDASKANVVNNTYPFWNIEHMYTKGQPSALAQALIDFVQSPATLQIRQRGGFIDLPDMTQAALVAKGSHS